ncbi:ion transporter [Saccharicrinis fermentans]|uniref:Ion transport protein n=1 Tax=Saccharicrinis fermentans DSM 9555 = JCM 21142 TaxID=869213 RepID=W7Y0N4_9BACT|nr:ion transporter [Saccharicrinis fermentans]GAF01512.1 ion transport protein [Saccharicrinis fermentans DSM 9555 = JCM 21142]
MVKRLFLNDKVILVLIILNSVLLFIGAYFTSPHDKYIFAIIDNSITTLFIFELFFKCQAYGFSTYFKSNWNKLDFVLVMLSLPALITFIFNVNLVDFSFFLVFRILRTFKTFRFLKFIPNIGELVAGVQRALKASVFVLLGFSIYIFMIGILSFYLFQNSSSEYFRNPMVALYSTFKIFTIEGWFEIPEQIIIGYSEIATFCTYLYFIFVVLTGGIFGLSIVNSIFVDSMVSDNNNELENKVDKLDSKLTELLTKIDKYETREDPRQR